MSQSYPRTPPRVYVFLAYPKPCTESQQKFIDRLIGELHTRGLEPRTLGVTDYDWDAPLEAIRRLMLNSSGLIAVALRRTYIKQGDSRYRSNAGDAHFYVLDNQWLTSPWIHIESAMAYQIDLPILILREEGVIAEGLLEMNVVGMHLPAFDLDDSPNNSLNDYFSSLVWRECVSKWESEVKAR